ncbi:MAG: D-alanyl-D-alanine carboxypeptidase [Pseudobdellovibrionaceae bacterium]
MNLAKSRILGFAITASLSLSAHAAQMKAQCYLESKDRAKVEGLAIDKRFEIASVSKIMTAHWAVATLGADYRYETQIHVTPISTDEVNLHVEGSHDPYFSRFQLQYLVAELNRLGVSKVKSLTFDENFKFLAATRVGAVAQGHFRPTDPSPERVASNLRVTLNTLEDSYMTLMTKAKDVVGLELPQKIALKVESISFVSKKDAKLGDLTKSYTMKSAPLHALLKEMNRNSNNYSANIIFEGLGGADEYHQFIDARLNTNRKKIRFVNGSGDSLVNSHGVKLYNEATCSTVIQVMFDLKTTLEAQGKHVEDVMAVAGADAEGDGRSTVTALYDNDFTDKALIAKTGTVNPAVTLAGYASTQKGLIYFGIIMGTDGSSADWREGRGLIRQKVNEMFKKYKGRVSVKYEPQAFFPIDSESGLTPVLVEFGQN